MLLHALHDVCHSETIFRTQDNSFHSWLLCHFQGFLAFLMPPKGKGDSKNKARQKLVEEVKEAVKADFAKQRRLEKEKKRAQRHPGCTVYFPDAPIPAWSSLILIGLD